MGRRRKERRQDDHTGMAFAIAGVFGCALIAAIDDILYSATDAPFWSMWRFHPASIFAGTLAFLGLLYLLQRMNDPAHAFQYLGPYSPLLGLSGLNLALKLDGAWLLPVAVGCIVWSVVQARRLRGRGLITRHISSFR